MNLSDLAQHAFGVKGAKDSGKSILIVSANDGETEKTKITLQEFFNTGRAYPDPRRPLPSRFIESPGRPLRYAFQFGHKGNISLASATSGAEHIFHNREGQLVQKYDLVATIGTADERVVELARGHGFRVEAAECAYDQPTPPKTVKRDPKDVEIERLRAQISELAAGSQEPRKNKGGRPRKPQPEAVS